LTTKVSGSTKKKTIANRAKRAAATATNDNNTDAFSRRQFYATKVTLLKIRK
jgi:hypothetical protein